VKAFDPGSGREVWSWRARHPMVASLLATAGDLVFLSEPTGDFNALHARTGELLLQFQTGSGIRSTRSSTASTAGSMSRSRAAGAAG